MCGALWTFWDSFHMTRIARYSPYNEAIVSCWNVMQEIGVPRPLFPQTRVDYSCGHSAGMGWSTGMVRTPQNSVHQIVSIHIYVSKRLGSVTTSTYVHTWILPGVLLKQPPKKKAWKEKKDKVLRGQRPAGITFLDNIFERRRGILIFGNYVDRNVFGWRRIRFGNTNMTFFKVFENILPTKRLEIIIFRNLNNLINHTVQDLI